MTKAPKDIIFPMDHPIEKAELIRRFVLQGYGEKRARYWIRQFVDLGLIYEENGVLDVEPMARERCRL